MIYNTLKMKRAWIEFISSIWPKKCTKFGPKMLNRFWSIIANKIIGQNSKNPNIRIGISGFQFQIVVFTEIELEQKY